MLVCSFARLSSLEKIQNILVKWLTKSLHIVIKALRRKQFPAAQHFLAHGGSVFLGIGDAEGTENSR